MVKKKPNMDVSKMNKVFREQRLEREKLVGKPRAKSFGGKPDPKKDRRSWRKGIDNG